MEPLPTPADPDGFPRLHTAITRAVDEITAADETPEDDDPLAQIARLILLTGRHPGVTAERPYRGDGRLYALVPADTGERQRVAGIGAAVALGYGDLTSPTGHGLTFYRLLGDWHTLSSLDALELFHGDDYRDPGTRPFRPPTTSQLDEAHGSPAPAHPPAGDPLIAYYRAIWQAEVWGQDRRRAGRAGDRAAARKARAELQKWDQHKAALAEPAVHTAQQLTTWANTVIPIADVPSDPRPQPLTRTGKW